MNGIIWDSTADIVQGAPVPHVPHDTHWHPVIKILDVYDASKNSNP